MKHSHRLALAAAFAGSAIAYGIHVFGKHDATQTAGADPAKLKVTSNERSRFPTKSVAGSEASNRLRPDLRSRKNTTATPAGAVAEFQPQKVGGSPAASVGGGVLSESEWHKQAARVEMEANHELSRLTTLLNLDATQQEKVFASLAQQSSNWQPGMQAGSNFRTGGIGTSNPSSGSVGGYRQGEGSSDGTTASNAGRTTASSTTGQTTGGPKMGTSGTSNSSLVPSGGTNSGRQTSGGSHPGSSGDPSGYVASSGGTQEGGPVTGTTMTTPSGQSTGPTGPIAEVASTSAATQGSGQSSASPTASETAPTLLAGAPTDSRPTPGEAAAPKVVELASSDPTEYLTQEQQDTLVEDAMDGLDWWAEILPQLLPPTVTTGITETLDFEGGDILLEE